MPSEEYIRDLENNHIFHSYGYDEGYKDGYAKGRIDAIEEFTKKIRELNKKLRKEEET